MRICLKKIVYKNIKKQQYAHTKSVAARLVDSENWSKNIFMYFFLQKYAHTKSLARLVDSENLSKHFFLQK